MSKSKGLLSRNFRVILLVAVVVVVCYLILRNITVFGNILLAVVGFGAVIIVHEFGHFIVAKLCGIKVEAFSIFMPPTVLGVQKTENGLRFRILPKFFPKEDDEPGDGQLSFTVGGAGKEWETEYRIGLIPFGGFVKMLGQEDVGPVKSSDDPRSYANKPVSVRVAVIAAGVIFNIVSAVIAFMVVFLIGINRVPAVVGGVVPNSPAAMAGLVAGDEVVEIAGESGNLEFSNILVAAALSGKDEEVGLKVRRADGSVGDFAMGARRMPGVQMRVFGILQPQSLIIEDVSDANALFERTGLLPGDHIKAVNGKEVRTYWELAEVIGNSITPTAAILAERAEGTSKGRLVESQIELSWDYADSYDVKSESELYHICSMVPRLRITYVNPPSVKNRFVLWLDKTGRGKTDVGAEERLQSGDIILAAGDVENPTYTELREVTEAYDEKELAIEVLREDADGIERSYTVIVVPERPSGVDRVMIGIVVVLDAEHAVVAKTIAAEDGPAALAIPRGAVITAVDGVKVSSFYDIAGQISRCAGRRITIDYRLDDQMAGGVSLNVEPEIKVVAVRSNVLVPFKVLKRLYKATGPVEAIMMGYEKTTMFIAQTYATLKTLMEGLVSPKELMGPVGILTLGYRVVSEQPLVYYVYLLGLISACIAVFNFLPLPPLDGGLVVLLLVEKIKGSALSERTQEIIAYAGWALIGSLALYVTFNDIVRSFFS